MRTGTDVTMRAPAAVSCCQTASVANLTGSNVTEARAV